MVRTSTTASGNFQGRSQQLTIIRDGESTSFTGQWNGRSQDLKIPKLQLDDLFVTGCIEVLPGGDDTLGWLLGAPPELLR